MYAARMQALFEEIRDGGLARADSPVNQTTALPWPFSARRDAQSTWGPVIFRLKSEELIQAAR